MTDLLLNMSPKFWIVGTLMVLAIHLAIYLPLARVLSQRRLLRWTIALVVAVLIATYVAAVMPNSDLDGLFFRNRLTLHFQAHLAIAVVLWIGGTMFLIRRRAV